MYKIRDSDGVVDKFTTASGLKYLRNFVGDTKPNLKKFLEAGSALITEDLLAEIYSLKSDDVDLRIIIKKLQKIVDSANMILILRKE